MLRTSVPPQFYVDESGRLMDTRRRICLMVDDEPTRLPYTPLVLNARGSVLVLGLGLGVCVRMIQELPQVLSIDVVELHQQVIELVEPTALFNSKVRVLQGDAWTFNPTDKYDTVWGDIFSLHEEITGPINETLRAHLKQFAKPIGYVGLYGDPS